MRSIATILMCILITSCASVPPYDVREFDEGEISYIYLDQQIKAIEQYFSSYLSRIGNTDGELIWQRAGYENALAEFVLPRGKYLLEIRCSSRAYYADITIEVEIEPPNLYEIYCSKIEGKNIFGMTVPAYTKAHLKKIDNKPQKPITQQVHEDDDEW